MPRISVIMPFHRVTPYLRPAVESVLGQTWSDFELLLVDDGSGAGLEPLGAVADDQRIRLVSQPENRGLAAASNAGVEQAGGEFIALMDSDDICLPHRLEAQLTELVARPNLGLLFGHTLAADDKGDIKGPYFTLTGEMHQYVFSAYSMPAGTPSLLARRNVFDRVPFRSEFRIAPDLDFTARAVEIWPSDALTDVVLHYRCHSGQTSARAYPQQQYDVCVTRLLTARRRAGREEDMTELLETCRAVWPDGPSSLDDVYRWFAERSLQEGFPLLAVYFVRKALAQGRALSWPVWRVAAAALRRGDASRGQLVRMLLTGPLRTHGLKPL